MQRVSDHHILAQMRDAIDQARHAVDDSWEAILSSRDAMEAADRVVAAAGWPDVVERCQTPEQIELADAATQTSARNDNQEMPRRSMSAGE